VSFLGFGGHPGVSGGFGSVGWLPLGPGDSFYPWYGQNGSQLKGVSVTDAINITRLTRVVAPLRDDNEFSNVSLAAVDGGFARRSRRFRRIASALDVLRRKLWAGGLFVTRASSPAICPSFQPEKCLRRRIVRQTRRRC